MQKKLTPLDNRNPVFPSPEKALKEPAGLLAIGGNLTTTTLLSAYRQGIFPWYEHGQPILWWSPDPRAVIYPEQIHISRSLKKSIKRSNYQVRTNTAFSSVIELCAALRSNSLRGTWITHEIKNAYNALHREGHAHSVEIWQKWPKIFLVKILHLEPCITESTACITTLHSVLHLHMQIHPPSASA